jgi:4-amino-4-deoxy-L-arabinose transferase-like glycosyltransferase
MTRIAWILLFALVLRLGFPLAVHLAGGGEEAFLRPDSIGYLALAKSTLEEGTFAQDGIAEINRTPGYPAMLMVGMALGSTVLVTVLLQAALGCLSVWLVYRLVRQLFSSTSAALWASVLLAIDPISILYASRILTEISFTSLVLLSLLLLVVGKERHGLVWYGLGGVVVAAVAYVRPTGYFLPFLWGGVILAGSLMPRCSCIRGRMVKGAFCMLAVSLLLTGVWQLRNLRQANYAGFSSISSLNIYFYKAAALQARLLDRSFYEQQAAIGYGNPSRYKALHPEQAGWSRAQRLRFMRDEGLRLLWEHPGVYAPIHLSGMLRCLLDPGTAEVLRSFGRYPQAGGMLGRLVDEGPVRTLQTILREYPLLFWLGLLMGGMLLLLLLAAVGGAGVAIRRRVPGIWLPLVTGGALLLLSGGPAALSRFRVPLMPLICLFAGVGLVELWGWLKLQRGREAA